jgi:hypothetical protein
MTSNKFVIEVEFDQEAWDSMGPVERQNWLIKVEDKINEEARVTSVFSKGS